jgi:hypothetical protein
MTIIYLSTKSKKTRKQREKQKDAWEEYKAKYGLTENKARTKQLVKQTVIQPVKPLSLRPGALDHLQHKSLNSGAAVAVKRERQTYTGTAIVGIATMHKSNIVPIFNEQAAKDVANMRRGNDQ